jgi:hypothetical protein
MRVLFFLSVRPLLTQFQGALVYTHAGPSMFELVRVPDAEFRGVFTYVSPVTSKWHMLIIESYIQGGVYSHASYTWLEAPAWRR